ncbi:alpha-D-ribose 1-methylphosphonate 5-triphosphate diphosphatase [Roseobacter sp. YSTF-M11]|uniref:Alpha-D-ribose 1-methylphosphonate 5-triphosphate diphosphatase n=1 Tax=Roseobacter insulae TaxID=2859783 RepID=A0A9X1FTA2_9RHOB|nr:alpha-D-ribose 1-methylphosphonate 5-triphosphate diphosphatase [Roseobacter insulae]MBW4707375.1 alpha-D-ribose 1-methylphosphonate 5-triphosphate diphosphatase [Roseobacter insulae]
MTQETVLTNARLVFPTEVVLGTVVLRNGKISDVSEGVVSITNAIDCAGDYLSPGLIELHTDNLERHMSPRPKIDWPHRAAIIAHDRELAGTGITTVFDAIRVGSITSNTRKRYGKYARRMADEILEMRDCNALKISHHIHLRAEICSETLIEELDEFGPDDKVGIVSLMDHTPGQRQFRDLKKFEDYVCGKNGLSREGFPEYTEFLYALQERLGETHEQAAVGAAARYGATLASHDDTTVEQVRTSKNHGVSIAEFPTTREAATACRSTGIATIMGSPNLVRGGSHSGNVAASELAEEGTLDILSSDYVPASLLQGALKLSDIWGDLARAMATVTAAPARHVGLDDRGDIAVGKRGDLVRFSAIGTAPLIKSVWSQGERVS